MKYLMLLFILVLTGCLRPRSFEESFLEPDENCLNGVLYYSFYSPYGISSVVAYDLDGSVLTCKEGH